jgi:hypothetical protein
VVYPGQVRVEPGNRRRVDVVRFSADGPFGAVSLKFSRRKRIAEAFRARGYSVRTLS